MRRFCIHLIIISAVLSICGCAGFEMTKPADFSAYRSDRDWYRALASDGVRIRGRLVESRSHGSTAMWRSSAEHYLRKKGYRFKTRSVITTRSGLKGSHAEFRYRYFGREFVYTMTVFVKEKYLGVVETSGEKDYYEKHRKELLEAIKTYRFK